MMLCDWQIAGLIRERGMIEPAVLHQVDNIDEFPGILNTPYCAEN